jgi:uncharacterized membrane protein YfcA
MRLWAFVSGAAVGALGGLIGLGGAEFRLPILLGVVVLRTRWSLLASARVI